MTRDELFRTLKRAVAGSFEVLAELGRGQGGRNAYVARELANGALVVLELNVEDSDADGTPNYGLFIRRELDASIPALSQQCNECGAEISGWARYCPNCDRDLSGVAHTTGGRSAAELLADGELAGHDRYEFLGEMPHAEGGGAVYFARERGSGRLVALRVEREGTGEAAGYKLTTTQTMLAVPSPDALHTPPQQPKVAWRGGEPASASPATPAAATPPPAAGAEGKAGGAGFCPVCGTSYEAGVWFCPRDGSPVKPAVVTDKLIGQTIAGRFRVERKLGSGGMGTVYLAEHVRIGRRCALKIMNPSLKDDPEALGRFAREAAHASRITHPNVAAIYDFGEAEDGTIYLAMEYADGESLGALMKREGALPPERASELVAQVLEGLAAAHALGIVHRDLKPDNIILASSPTGKQVVKVVDFGIAKAMQTTDSQQLTRTGFVVGTPRYMSPEQITGGTIDGRTDLYSADCILYELLVGAAPFSDPSGAITITRRLSEPPPHPRRAKREVPRQLDQVVVRGMARNPDERFPTAEAFRAALTAATRQDAAGAWTRSVAVARRAGASVGAAGAKVGGAGAIVGSAGTKLGRAAFSGVAGLALGVLRSVGRAGGSVRSLAVRSGSACARAAGALLRVARPVLGWKAAVVVLAVAVLGAGTPSVVRWLTRPVVLPQADSTAVVMPGTEASDVASAHQPAPGDPPATAPSASPELPATTPQTPSVAEPAVPLVPAPAVLDSLRNKLRLANLFAEREEYADAFDQLRLVRSRLDDLRLEFPAAAEVRALRQEHGRAASSITTQCEVIRKIALDRGEAPPVCR